MVLRSRTVGNTGGKQKRKKEQATTGRVEKQIRTVKFLEYGFYGNTKTI